MFTASNQRHRNGSVSRSVCAVFVVATLARTAVGAEASDVVRGQIITNRRTEVRTVDHVTVFRTTGTDRRLDFVTVVPAGVDDVWHALTTVEGIQSFHAPGATIDLRPGGTYEIHFPPDARSDARGSEGTKVLSFVPREILSGTAAAPPEFPTVRKEKTKWVTLLDAVAGGTRVQTSMIEWPDGHEWDRAFDYFADHTPPFLEALYTRFANGPIDGKKRGVTVDRPKLKQGIPSDKQGAPGEKLWRVDKSILVEARLDPIWRLFTTSDGLKSWAAPGANVDLRFGGLYERLANPTAPKGRRGQEGTRILSYIPQEILSYTWLAPVQFPEVRRGPAWETWRFTQPSPGWVRIHYTGLGIGAGTQWQDAFNLLDRRMDLVMGNLRAYLQR